MIGRPKALLQDRRRPRRIALRGALEGSLGLRGRARVLDLSPHGAQFEHARPLAQGETVVLTLRLGGVDLRLPARIAWTQPHRVQARPGGEAEPRFRSGIQFRDEGTGAETHIRHYLTTLGRADPGLDEALD